MSTFARSRRAAATLWFPYFFAAAFAVMFLLACAAPQPHGVRIAVVGSPAETSQLTRAIESAAPAGFETVVDLNAVQARTALAQNELAAVYELDIDGTDHLTVNSAASPTRSSFLERFFTDALPAHASVHAPRIDDAVPTLTGDVSGVGLFFFALPILLTGMITSIVLLQVSGWHTWRKALAQAAAGAFGVVFSFAAAVSLDVIPPVFWLIPLGFALTQAIGWLTTSVALLTRRFFMPISMTFVLILNIPASGGTVNGDMVPPFIGVLHEILPFGNFIDAARSVAYFDGAGAAAHIANLLAWAVAGGLLLAFAHRRTRAQTAAAVASDAAKVAVAV